MGAREERPLPLHVLVAQITRERDAAQQALADHLHECSSCEDRTCGHRSHATQKWCDACGIWLDADGVPCGTGMLRGAAW